MFLKATNITCFRAWNKEFSKYSDSAMDIQVKDLEFAEDYEWERHVGFRDKNGVLVYVNDVCTFEGAKSMLVVVRDSYIEEVTDEGEPCVVPFCYIKEGELAVVGNIHEASDFSISGEIKGTRFEGFTDPLSLGIYIMRNVEGIDKEIPSLAVSWAWKCITLKKEEDFHRANVHLKASSRFSVLSK